MVTWGKATILKKRETERFTDDIVKYIIQSCHFKCILLFSCPSLFIHTSIIFLTGFSRCIAHRLYCWKGGEVCPLATPTCHIERPGFLLHLRKKPRPLLMCPVITGEEEPPDLEAGKMGFEITPRRRRRRTLGSGAQLQKG